MANMRPTKTFVAIFALAERLPTSATLLPSQMGTLPPPPVPIWNYLKLAPATHFGFYQELVLGHPVDCLKNCVIKDACCLADPFAFATVKYRDLLWIYGQVQWTIFWIVNQPKLNPKYLYFIQSKYGNNLSSNSNNKNMPQVVTTEAYYPPVATTWSRLCPKWPN